MTGPPSDSISAAGTAIHFPEAAPGAEATALCQAVSIAGALDDTDAGSGSPVWMWVLSRGHLPRFPFSVLPPCAVQAQALAYLLPLSPGGLWKPPVVKSSKCLGCAVVFGVFRCAKAIPLHPCALFPK